MTSKVCINCDNPVKKIEEALPVNMTIPEGGQFSPSAAAELMSQMSDLVTKMNGTAAALSLGESVKGVIVKQKDPTEMNEISLAYDSPIRNFDLIEDRGKLVGYSRFVTVSKEAFDKAKGPNMTSPFAAVLKFTNMSQENITILGNEVLAVEMGASIQNLTDTVNISVNKIKFQGIPVCNSWDGKGDVNWTTDGCETLVSGDNIICQCTHLTFFAILLTPLNGTNSISTYDLNTLTTLTRVGCGLSMFFLCIVLFMHFLIRKTKPNISTVLFIHLVTALLLLNFTFLINDLVANLNNPTGCEAIAFLMHYFMLVTFTWFAVHAFHLCLQMYMGSNVTIKRYVLKVSVTSWTLPSIFGIVFLITKKYGELRIYTSDSEKITKM
uniref:G-protein coupled receptors family 2 profile 2 domain-containing protein n=1 Tax=Oryzias sinensis TaxID=183150 RepID=A0A8C8DIS0_9TELE